LSKACSGPCGFVMESASQVVTTYEPFQCDTRK
jgi:hypothetical protein